MVGRRGSVLLGGLLMSALSGCNCGGIVTVPDGSIAGVGGGTGAGATGGNGGTGGNAGDLGGGTGGGGDILSPDASCASVSSQATLGKKPVDIILVIDNSGSMTAEITGVENNINSNFATILNDGGLDYRVILLSKHGSATADQSICIMPPLSANSTCTPPEAMPTNGPNFFHYSTEIGSTNSLNRILSTFTTPDPSGQADAGWQMWLRPDALKVFLEITDDNSSMNANNFDTQLLALSPQHFGTAAARNYVFHSITGIEAKTNPAEGYLATEPLVSGKCPSGVNAGNNFQNLSILTGGLRFPVCTPSLFNTVFTVIANEVVAGAQVACQFARPPLPQGISMFNKIIVQYTPSGGGAVQSFNSVGGPTSCSAGKFYVEMGTSKVILCPETCTTVQGDPMAKLDVLFTCEPEIN